MKFLKNSFREDHQILHSYREQLTSQVCWIASDWLQNKMQLQIETAEKCVKRSDRPNRRNIRPLFNLESPIFCTNIHAANLYSDTAYEVASYFRSTFIEVHKKRPKMPPPAALVRISRQLFKRGSRNCLSLSRTVSHIYLPDIAWLAAFGRLQIAIEYCV